MAADLTFTDAVVNTSGQGRVRRFPRVSVVPRPSAHPQQALLGLQAFARFLMTHRHSTDLEADIRANLRREGLMGAIEIIMHHEVREIGE
jgi:hypothetical protein